MVTVSFLPGILNASSLQSKLMRVTFKTRWLSYTNTSISVALIAWPPVFFRERTISSFPPCVHVDKALQPFYLYLYRVRGFRRRVFRLYDGEEQWC